MDSLVDIRELLSACWHLAEAAGTIASEVIEGGDLQIAEKEGPTDLVTIADLRVQAAITGALLKKWPTLHIVGEEAVTPQTENVIEVETERVKSYFEEKSFSLPEYMYPLDSITLYVDPLDGTREFTRALYSHVSVLIGIAYNSEPIAGVVYHPWHCEDHAGSQPQKIQDSTKQVYWGIVGYGIAGLEGKPKPTRGLNELLAADSNVRPSRVTSKLKPAKIISKGGCGSKCTLVFEGEIDVYVIGSATKKWDTCAAHALLRSIGGDIVDFEGKSLEYHKGVEIKNPQCLVCLQHRDELLQLINSP
jgi:3'(2'), 5'-bisphosphate nucleotidase